MCLVQLGKPSRSLQQLFEISLQKILKMSSKSFIAIICVAFVVMHAVQSAAVQSYDEYDCICTREYMPICASNGVTFPNLCFYKCEKERNKELSIKFHGHCDEETLDKIYQIQADHNMNKDGHSDT